MWPDGRGHPGRQDSEIVRARGSCRGGGGWGEAEKMPRRRSGLVLGPQGTCTQYLAPGNLCPLSASHKVTDDEGMAVLELPTSGVSSMPPIPSEGPRVPSGRLRAEPRQARGGQPGAGLPGRSRCVWLKDRTAGAPGPGG